MLDASVLGLPAPPRRARYLFISFRSIHRVPLINPSQFGSASDENNGQEMERTMGRAIRRVLAAVAAHVEILDLHTLDSTFDHKPKCPPKRPISFPRLTDLSSNSYPLISASGPIQQTEPPRFPSLRRWHLTRPVGLHNVELFDCVSKLAPYLTHCAFQELILMCPLGVILRLP